MITGTDTIPCPECRGELKHYDRRERRSEDTKGAKIICRIRRLRCQKCRRLHNELPDFIVPYKRYSAEVIVSVSEGKDTDVPYEGRTRQRIKAWYKKVTNHLLGVWRQQVALGFGSPHIVPSFVSLVRATVNSGYWRLHPFGRTAYAF